MISIDFGNNPFKQGTPIVPIYHTLYIDNHGKTIKTTFHYTEYLRVTKRDYCHVV